MRFRYGLFAEVITMALATVRTNKLRSGLTILGIVIGISSIVGMTSLIRGFDQSFRDSLREIGPNTIYVQRFGLVSFGSGKDFTELIRRPTLTIGDARAIEEQAPSVQMVDIMLGAGPGPPSQERVFFGRERTKPLFIFGSTEKFADVGFLHVTSGRFFTEAEVQHRRNVVVLGNTAYDALFPNRDPVGKSVRIGAARYTVLGVLGKRPSPGGFNLGQDDFAVIPYTTYQRQFGMRVARPVRGSQVRAVMIAVVPREDVPRDQAMAEVERVMRIRHGLRLEQPNDFDLVTQDAALKVWDQVSRATFLALVVISSIALMVGGIGVMAIMMISVTERTREIGVRKALGARRREILWQFLAEAVFLTSIGGLLGILFGGSIGVGVHYLSGFPISLPWWSFSLGIGFSAAVGIFFGLFPAFKASRLDPIEALRYE